MKRPNSNFRILVIFICIFLMGGIISFNVFFTTLSGYHLRSLTNVLAEKEGSQEKTEVLSAKRGYIRDRNGEIIAQDQETYSITAILSPDRPGEYAYAEDKEFTAQALAPILGMSEEEILGYLNQDLYQTSLGEKGNSLTLEQKNQIEAIEYTPDPEKTTLGLPGIEFERTTTRVYTPGKIASTLLGFASYDSEQQKIVGQVGIEAWLDEELSGTDGYSVYQKDAYGYKLPNTETTMEMPVNGKDVYLTIDKDVQSALEAALQDTIDYNGAERAWAVIMEVETGRILAWGGYPTYDLNTREEVLYFDIPSMFVFEPGSVMKPFVFTAAMEEGVYKGEDTVTTGRYCVAYNETTGDIYRSWEGCPVEGNINDANRTGWGTISFDEGLVRSSNTVVATLVTDYLGDDKLWDYLDLFGFFRPTGVQGLEMSEEAGIRNDTYALDRLSASFGQGSAVTTLQLMQAYTAIFNDGVMVKPYYIDKIVDPNTNEVEMGETEYVYTDEEGNPIQILSKETCERVRALMYDVVNDKEKGTGTVYKIDGIEMIAKTGTGEIATSGGYGTELYTSSIMAAAPADDPKIMMYYAFQSPNFQNYSSEYFKHAFMAAYDAMGINTQQNAVSEYDVAYEEWKEYEMPSLNNHTMTYANWKLDEMNVHRIIIGDGNLVMEQYPLANDSVTTNQNVFIKTDGTNITMPNMYGWTYREVEIYKSLTGLNITMNGTGVVSWQNLDEGTPLYADTDIQVTLT